MGRKYMAAWVAASLGFVCVRHQTGLCAHFSKITLPSAMLNLSSHSHFLSQFLLLLYTSFVTCHFLTFLSFLTPFASLSFLSAVIHTSYSFHNLSPPISSHPLLSVSSLPGDADSYSTLLSTSHSFISCLLASAPAPAKPPNSSLARSRWKEEKQEFYSHPVILFFCPALMVSPLSFHLSRCKSWTCAPQGCWTMCSAFSPTTWSRRLAVTTPPVVLRWQPCRRSCATFWSYVQKTGPVMTPFWFSTVGTRTKALVLGHWLVRDPQISALTFL